MRTCPRCKTAKPDSEFSIYRGARRCKRCLADDARMWRTKNLEELNSKRRQHYRDKLRHDPKIQAGYRERALKKFGLTPEGYDNLLASQGGVCAICGKTEKAKNGRDGNPLIRRMAVDHDHATGKVRGILCARCNIVLGWIENRDLFHRMMTYLKGSD